MKVDVLGVKIDDLNMAGALSVVEKWIWNPGPDPRQSRDRGSSMNEIHRDKHYIVTPNPEFVIAAQKDKLFKKILNDADLSIPDGMGLKLSGKVKNTISGTDFMEKLVGFAAEKGFVVGFLGGKDGVAKRCAECLKKKYPGLKVAFSESGGEINGEGSLVNASPTSVGDSSLIAQNDIAPVDILFVAFGHIKQEKWIESNLKMIPVKLAMGVGGAFDYLSGDVPRAPKWMRDLGFEWLFRLMLQPWRIKRQLSLLRYLWLLTKGY